MARIWGKMKTPAAMGGRGVLGCSLGLSSLINEGPGLLKSANFD